MKKIAIVTSTRAEFGILQPLIRLLKDQDECSTELIVTGSHLHAAFGQTESEIISSGLKINHRIEIFKKAPKSSLDMGLVAAEALKQFSTHFAENSYDLVVLLGDRFEILSVAQAAFFQRIPIAHLHGGELSLGSMDDSLRHAITKLSSLHFTSTLEYKKRVEQLGEQPSHVFHTGAPGLDAFREGLLSSKDLESELSLDLSKKTALCTFHPVTSLSDNGLNELKAFTKGLTESNIELIVMTMPNIDPGNDAIRAHLIDFEIKTPQRVKNFESLGHRNYTSLIKAVNIVAGNSSSGLIEAPYFAKPVVNVGIRQEGRASDSSLVFNVSGDAAAITEAVNKQLSLSVSTDLLPSTLHGRGKSSQKILDTILKFDLKTLIPKRFYDQ